MVNYCVCAGCNNSNNTGHRVHRFPAAKGASKLWVRFVRIRRADFSQASVTHNSVICSAHFKKEDYRQGDLLEWDLGYRTLANVRLKAESVPTIHTPKPPVLNDDVGSSAIRKVEMINDGASCSTDDLQCCEVVSQPQELPQETLLIPNRQQVDKQDQGTQCKPRNYRSVGIQVCLPGKSVSTQCQAPAFVSIGLQCNPDDLESLEIEESGDEYDDPIIDQDKKDPSWTPCSDDEDDDEEDDYGSECEGQDEVVPHTRKFIVCEDQLLDLFKECTFCHEKSSCTIKKNGTMIEITQICQSCDFRRVWQNQSFLHRNMPECNIELSGAIHFTGCMPGQALRMLKVLGLQVISEATYYRHQRLYTAPAVIKAWAEEQERTIQSLRSLGGDLILSGDCRSDSPGHCAKFGTYTLIEDRLNKVVDLQLVQSTEVPNSTWCEVEGLQRAVQFLKEKDLSIGVLVTDRNRQVAKYIRENLKDTRHHYDVWHCAKGLAKKLDAKQPDIKVWKQSIVNHLYWTAASTPDGDPDIMEAKWLSLINHVQDVHLHESSLFPACLRGPLEDEDRQKAWLEPGSQAAVELEDLLTKKIFVKDIRMLSPSSQTYSLEAFHSLILRFAPKHTGFAFVSMQSRLLLAALHHNSNSDREQAKTKAGDYRYAVRYPRFKKGGHSVRPIKTQPSYGYVYNLLHNLKEAYARSPAELSSESTKISDPGTLAASYPGRTEKEAAVMEYLTRKSRFSN